jgi:hypothetical protein
MMGPVGSGLSLEREPKALPDIRNPCSCLHELQRTRAKPCFKILQARYFFTTQDTTGRQ